jgi:hypothetical protein
MLYIGATNLDGRYARAIDANGGKMPCLPFVWGPWHREGESSFEPRDRLRGQDCHAIGDLGGMAADGARRSIHMQIAVAFGDHAGLLRHKPRRRWNDQ